MFECFSEFLEKNGYEYEEYISLGRMSYMRIDTIARFIVYPKDEKAFINIIDFLSERPFRFTVLGNISNVLFKDAFYDGIIVKTTKYKIKCLAEAEFELGCGAMLAPVVRQMADDCRGGFEGLLGIPGTVGGMLRQNAGAFGYEISDRFICARIYDARDKKITKYSKADMRFTYRDSILRDKDLILLSATFDTVPRNRKDIHDDIKAFAEKRKASQPINLPSLGSTFKRVGDVSAGYYIDNAGLKGIHVGGAAVSTKHAGFIVNSGSATSADVLKLIDMVKNSVYQKFGILLEEEIEII